MDYTLFDGLALGDVLGDPVNPKPFRLFAAGKNELTRNGQPYSLTLSAEEIRSMAEYNARKGEKIPIDSRHALFLSAEKAGISEAEAVKAVPGKVAALGFASLEAREDGLYATEIELLPLGLLEPGDPRAGREIAAPRDLHRHGQRPCSEQSGCPRRIGRES